MVSHYPISSPHYPLVVSTGHEREVKRERAIANDEHVFPYIVAHVSMLYKVYND